MTTRREFLKQTAVVAAGAFLLPNSFNINILSKPKVVILGAGFAGLSAGYKLKQKGFDVTILEARNRIGGRVFSHVIDKEDNLVIELGGEWVGASHTRIAELCSELGLELQDNTFNSHLIYSNHYSPYGSWSYSDEWNKKYKNLIEEYLKSTEQDKINMDKISWWRFLMNNGISERDMQITELFNSTDFGEGARHFSAFMAMAEYAGSSPRNEMDLKIKGGNSQFAFKLAEKIGNDNIKLQQKVIEIDQQSDKIRVTCLNGNVFDCDEIVCAIPTHSMQKINWKPALPQEKIDAINSLIYARINKNAFLFNERFWKDESFDIVTDTYGHYFYHGTKSQKSDKGVLISYTIGDKADVIQRQNKKFKQNVAVQSLQPAFGDVSDKILKQINYYWGTDEYSKGAYAMYGIGQWFTIQPILASKFMKVHFAGEHIAEWQGYMEGAVNSGEIAADEIIG